MFQFNVGREKRSVQVHKDILAVLLKILKYGVPSIGSAKRNHLNTFGTVGPAIEWIQSVSQQIFPSSQGKAEWKGTNASMRTATQHEKNDVNYTAQLRKMTATWCCVRRGMSNHFYNRIQLFRDIDTQVGWCNANCQQLVSVLTLQVTSTVFLSLSDFSNVQMNILLLLKKKKKKKKTRPTLEVKKNSNISSPQ